MGWDHRLGSAGRKRWGAAGRAGSLFLRRQARPCQAGEHAALDVQESHLQTPRLVHHPATMPKNPHERLVKERREQRLPTGWVHGALMNQLNKLNLGFGNVTRTWKTSISAPGSRQDPKNL